MKKLFLSILLTLLSILASAETVEIDGIWYNLIPKGNIAEVTSNQSGDCYSGDVVIPDKVTYNGVEYLVTTVSGFSNCSGLKTIKIPDSVTKINDSAFMDCNNLSIIYLSKNLIDCGDYAFAYCYNIDEVHITDLESFCKINFGYTAGNPLCYAKKLYLNGEEVHDISFPKGFDKVNNYAFNGYRGLTSVIIPEGVTSIGEGAFDGCFNLISISLPSSLKSIGKEAFRGCNSLPSLNIPESVSYIGPSGFLGCLSLTNLSIPTSLESIDT